MKYYSLLVTHLEIEMDKEWKDLIQNDLDEMDKKAYDDLKSILEINDWRSFGFKHYKTLDDLQKDFEDGI